MAERLRPLDFKSPEHAEVWEKFFGPHPQRCSRGHEFPRLADAAGKVLWVGGERFCLVCLLPLLRQLCGTVAEVKPADAPPAPDAVTGRPDEYL